MLQLDNETPYPAERAVLVDGEGAKVWVIAVKATFVVSPDGSCTPARHPEPVASTARFDAEPGASTLLRDPELVAAHPGTAVTLNASAYALGNAEVAERIVGFAIGPLHKRLRVTGDRWWVRTARGLAIGRTVPFRSMPLVWERAFGGPGGTVDPQTGAPPPDAPQVVDDAPWPANPIGVGRRVPSRLGAGGRLPNVEYGDDVLRTPDDRPATAGFCAVPPGWSPRRELGGTFDAVWRATRCPLWPADYDPRHHLAAPADQVAPDGLRGGERVTLDGLTPGGGTFAFDLPRIHLGFETFWRRGGWVRHRAQLDRVILEPNASRVVMVWRTALACGNDARAVDTTVLSAKRMLR